jgi:hypothetical protein
MKNLPVAIPFTLILEGADGWGISSAFVQTETYTINKRINTNFKTYIMKRVLQFSTL